MFKEYLKLFDEEDFNFKTCNYLSEIGEKTFLDMYTKVFREIDKKIFYWYEEDTLNTWGFLEDKNKTLIGVYGLKKMKFNSMSKIYRGYLCHNVGISSDYEGKGLFQHIGYLTINNTVSDEEVVLGFPNKLSIKGHLRLGWKKLGDVSFYSLSNIKEFESSIIMKSNIHEILEFDESIEDFFNKFYEKYTFSMNKDFKYLNWRCSRPKEKYRKFLLIENDKIKGYLVLKNYKENNQKKLHIVDYGYLEEKDLKELIYICKEIFSKEGYDVLNLWIVDDSFESNIFKNHDFIKNSNSSYPIILFSKKEIDEKLLKERMFFTLFDNDVF